MLARFSPFHPAFDVVLSTAPFEVAPPARTEVQESDEAFTLSLDLPGHEPQGITLELKERTLSLSSTRGQRTLRRAFTLPASVDTEKAQASYRNGVLTVVLPKREDARARVIPVNVA